MTSPALQQRMISFPGTIRVAGAVLLLPLLVVVVVVVVLLLLLSPPLLLLLLLFVSWRGATLLGFCRQSS
jgi:hypothetical protein